LLPLIAFASWGCAAAPVPPASGPEAAAGPLPGKAPPPSAAVFAVEGPVREEWLPLLKPAAVDPAKAKLLAPPPGLAPVPPACDAFVARKGGGPAPKPPAACSAPAAALAALDAALARPTPDQRDAALVELDTCAGLPPGVARAIRAELAPVAC